MSRQWGCPAFIVHTETYLEHGQKIKHALALFALRIRGSIRYEGGRLRVLGALVAVRGGHVGRALGDGIGALPGIGGGLPEEGDMVSICNSDRLQ